MQPWRLCRICPLKNLLRLTIGNDDEKHCYIVYYRFLKRTGKLCGAKLDRVTSGLGRYL